MAAFASIFRFCFCKNNKRTIINEIIRKLTHMLLVGIYFGPQEDLGAMCIVSAFTEDVDKLARTALDDATASDAGSYGLHSVLRAIL
jgi:hypothetical protein